MSAGGLGGRRAVWLVARREFLVQVAKKSFIVSNLVVVVAIVAGVVGFSLFSGDDDAARVGLVGEAGALAAPLTAAGEALGTPVETTDVDDEEQGREAVLDEDLEVLVVPSAGGGVTAVTVDEPDAALQAVLETVVAQEARRAALTDRGVDPDEVDAQAAGAAVTSDVLDPPDPESGQRTALAAIAVFLMYSQLIAFGMYVAMGVVEEKSSRVVELLLSTIRPLHLLWGKILGIGAVGLLQLAVYGVAGIGAGTASGALTITGTAVGVFASVLGWFVLGFGFFAVLYAAGGSMVSRQEDVNSTTSPLLILILAMFGVAFVAIGDPGGTLSTVLGWIPPFSAILMPLRVAADVATPLQVVGSAVLMVLVTLALAALAARIYQRSILRTGSQVAWREALGRSPRDDGSRARDEVGTDA